MVRLWKIYLLTGSVTIFPRTTIMKLHREEPTQEKVDINGAYNTRRITEIIIDSYMLPIHKRIIELLCVELNGTGINSLMKYNIVNRAYITRKRKKNAVDSYMVPTKNRIRELLPV